MKTGTEAKVLKIAKNSSETMTLSGVAGKKPAVESSDLKIQQVLIKMELQKILLLYSK